MESNQSNSSAIENIWKFIRGDMSISDFENWVYSNPTLENLFGKTLHLEIISTNFSSNVTFVQTEDEIEKTA